MSKRVEGADFSGARLHAADFGGAKITDGWFLDADLSGFIGGMRINGVDIAPLVSAELDRQFPERVTLRAEDPAGLGRSWQLIERVWAETVDRARALPAASLQERVDGEWSFLETLRHLVFATDCWFFRMVRAEAKPYHPWGVAGSFLDDPAALGLDQAAEPQLTEVLAVRASGWRRCGSTSLPWTPPSSRASASRPPAPGIPRPSSPC